MESVQWITVFPCLPDQGVGKIESEAGMEAFLTRPGVYKCKHENNVLGEILSREV